MKFAWRTHASAKQLLTCTAAKPDVKPKRVFSPSQEAGSRISSSESSFSGQITSLSSEQNRLMIHLSNTHCWTLLHSAVHAIKELWYLLQPHVTENTQTHTHDAIRSFDPAQPMQPHARSLLMNLTLLAALAMLPVLVESHVIGGFCTTQGIQRQPAQEVAVPIGIGGSKGSTSFHDDSPVFRRPMHAAAAVDISHRWVPGQLLAA